MTTVNLKNIDLIEFTGKVATEQRCLATFPMLGHHGTRDLATVYFELDPGDHLGSHRDSAEELLVILDGDVEIIVGDEKQKASKDTIALVPKMVLHNVINTGNTRARILGIFGGANHIVATFENEWLPTHSRVVDTAQTA